MLVGDCRVRIWNKAGGPTVPLIPLTDTAVGAASRLGDSVGVPTEKRPRQGLRVRNNHHHHHHYHYHHHHHQRHRHHHHHHHPYIYPFHIDHVDLHLPDHHHLHHHHYHHHYHRRRQSQPQSLSVGDYISDSTVLWAHDDHFIQSSADINFSVPNGFTLHRPVHRYEESLLSVVQRCEVVHVYTWRGACDRAEHSAKGLESCEKCPTLDSQRFVGPV